LPNTEPQNLEVTPNRERVQAFLQIEGVSFYDSDLIIRQSMECGGAETPL
jgi:hypothetical protein